MYRGFIKGNGYPKTKDATHDLGTTNIRTIATKQVSPFCLCFDVYKQNTITRMYLENALLALVAIEQEQIEGQVKLHKLLKMLKVCAQSCKSQSRCQKHLSLKRAVHFYHICKQTPGLIVHFSGCHANNAQDLFFGMPIGRHARRFWGIRWTTQCDNWRNWNRWESLTLASTVTSMFYTGVTLHKMFFLKNCMTQVQSVWHHRKFPGRKCCPTRQDSGMHTFHTRKWMVCAQCLNTMLHTTSTSRELPWFTSGRFNALGSSGCTLLQKELGVLHVDCSTRNKVVSIVTYFGYRLAGMVNIHSVQGWRCREMNHSTFKVRYSPA